MIRVSDTIQIDPYIEYGAGGVFGAEDSGTWLQAATMVSTDVRAPQVRVRFLSQYDVTVDVWMCLSN